MQPTTVAPASPGTVLDQNFAENRVAAMRQMGATNVDPPLARSAYLKNTRTGLVLPWTPGLAEQRDIMVNCDEYGNTDPATWGGTVNPVDYSESEQAELMQQAMTSIAGHRQHEIPMPEAEMNKPVEFPHGARPLEEFMAEANAVIVNELDAMLE